MKLRHAVIAFLFLVALALVASGAPSPVNVDTKTRAVTVADGSNVMDFKSVTLTLGSVTVSDAAGIRTFNLGSTNGTKIGATGDKIGFLGATPIVRPSGNAFTALVNLGLITSPSLTTTNITGFDAALDARQPLNPNLTSIAALATTAFGRDFLVLANVEAAKSKLAYVFADIGSTPTTLSGYGIIDDRPSVVVQRPDGTSAIFQTAADTDVARGTALMAAVAASATGDVILAGPGTFLAGPITLPSNVSLLGAGLDVTIIKGTTSGILLTPGDNSIISDLTLDGTTTPFPVPIGTTIDTLLGFVNVKVYRCKLLGADDCFFFQIGTACSLTAYDCIVTARWDCVLMNQSTGSFRAYNCDFTSTGNGTNNIARCISGVDGTVKIYGGTLKATGGTSQNVAVQSGTSASNVIELHNLTIESGTGGSVANADLAQQGSATIRINNIARTDGAALSTTGTISTLSRNLIRENNLSDLTNAATARSNLGLVNEDVIKPSLLNSWVDFGGGLQDAGYYKASDGRVWIRGNIKNGVTTNATTLFTLPVNYRPLALEAFAITSNLAHAEIQISSNGEVKIYGANSAHVSLGSISFRTD